MIPKDLTFKTYLKKLNVDDYWYEVYEKLVDRVGGEHVKTYEEFMRKVRNLGIEGGLNGLGYWDFYEAFYPSNKDVKGKNSPKPEGLRVKAPNSPRTRRNNNSPAAYRGNNTPPFGTKAFRDWWRARGIDMNSPINTPRGGGTRRSKGRF